MMASRLKALFKYCKVFVLVWQLGIGNHSSIRDNALKILFPIGISIDL